MLLPIVLFLFLIVTIYDWSAILKQAETRVRIIHISVMLVSFCILILYSLNVDVPSPTKAITHVVEAIFRLKG